MPIEIKELVIRAVVAQEADPLQDAGSSVSAAAASPGTDAATEDIIQECVRQVLRILEKNKER
jgi:hypothetical protein